MVKGKIKNYRWIIVTLLFLGVINYIDIQYSFPLDDVAMAGQNCGQENQRGAD